MSTYLSPSPLWSGNPKEKNCPPGLSRMRETQPLGKSLSCPCERPNQPSSCPSLRPLMLSMVSDVANARFLNFDKIDEAKNELSVLIDLIDTKQVSDVVESELLGSDESEESRNGLVCTIDSDESLERDLQLILQEHSGNIVKK